MLMHLLFGSHRSVWWAWDDSGLTRHDTTTVCLPEVTSWGRSFLGNSVIVFCAADRPACLQLMSIMANHGVRCLDRRNTLCSLLLLPLPSFNSRCCDHRVLLSPFPLRLLFLQSVPIAHSSWCPPPESLSEIETYWQPVQSRHVKVAALAGYGWDKHWLRQRTFCLLWIGALSENSVIDY